MFTPDPIGSSDPRERTNPQWSPGVAVGAGGALTVGEKLLGPPKVPFSEGDTGTALVLAGVVLVVDVGASFSPLPHAVIRPAKPTVKATAATADRRRIFFIMHPRLCEQC